MVTGKKQQTKVKAAAPKASKVVKGKAKAKVAPSAPVKEPSPEEDDEDDEDDFEDDSEDDEDEDNGGISEKGMKRLMELVGPEDLDEFEIAQLAGSDEGEDEDQEDDEEDDDEEDEEEEEETAEANSILIDEADPDTIAVDEMASDVSLDEDAVPQRKVTANNGPAMRVLTEGIKMTNTPWPEHLIVQSKTVLDVDPSDDLQRETAFYKLALDAVPQARALCAKYDIPFSRPTDYYAEMVKSDEHMERVRTKLVEESQGIKKSEEAKKQRELKKYGKQIQIEKLKQRDQDKKSFNDKMAGVKRKRKEGMEIGDEDDDFGISVEDDRDDRPGRGRGPGGKPKIPRSARDAKYSLGGSSRRAKQNTRESANDIPGWNEKAGAKKGPKGRPGKSKRHSRRK